MAGGYTMAAMMGGGPGVAGVPTQTYNAANILGTAVPSVGDSKARPNYAAGVAGAGKNQIVIVAVILFGVGYLAYHFNFER